MMMIFLKDPSHGSSVMHLMCIAALTASAIVIAKNAVAKKSLNVSSARVPATEIEPTERKADEPNGEAGQIAVSAASECRKPDEPVKKKRINQKFKRPSKKALKKLEKALASERAERIIKGAGLNCYRV